jgi:predicted RNase H-like HicB family nuclease
MTTKTVRDKIRRGVKDDSSLHEFYWKVRRQREAKCLPPPEADPFDPKEVFAEWRREQRLMSSSAPTHRKNDRGSIREFPILITPAPAHGYWAYCPAIDGKGLYGETIAEAENKMASYLKNLGRLVAQGKPLPKTGARVKKVKIAVPSLK